MLAWLAVKARCGIAQAKEYSGPLTSRLTDTEPVGGAIDLGPVTLAPGIGVREIGWDSNVFNEPPEQSPKDDWVLSVQPDVAAFSRMRLVQLRDMRGRFHLLPHLRKRAFHRLRLSGTCRLAAQSRLRPFVGGGQTETRERPNGEIDVRAERREDELGRPRVRLVGHLARVHIGVHLRHGLRGCLPARHQHRPEPDA